MKNKIDLGNIAEKDFENWIKCVGYHASKRFEAGESIEDAMKNGMEDHSKSLIKLYTFFMRDSEQKKTLVTAMADEIYLKIRKEA